MNKGKIIKSFDSHLDENYGKVGTKSLYIFGDEKFNV